MKDFTRRITNSNRSELVIVKFEILFYYLQEAIDEKQKQDHKNFKSNIRNADAVLVSFQETLDFQYELAGNLYILYVYCREQLAQAMYTFDETGIQNAQKVLNGLYESFCEVAKQDCSKPLMQNTQQVYAGMTYQKGQINENFGQADSNRGFYI